MSDIAQQTRQLVEDYRRDHPDVVWLNIGVKELLSLADEIERLWASEATFHEDYRKKCDVETKALHVKIEQMEREIARLAEAQAELAMLEDASALDLARQCRKELQAVNRQNDELRRERDEARALLLDIDQWFRQDGASFPDYIQGRLDAALGGRYE